MGIVYQIGPAVASQDHGNCASHRFKDIGIIYAGKADDLIHNEVVLELKLEAASEA